MELQRLERRIDVSFQNKELLKQALVHRSFLNENPDFGLSHNERLEFLGDAVLELVVTDYLYRTYDQMPEGELTNLRAAVVRGEMLSKVADEIGLNDFLLLSRGERKDTGKARQYILANAVEALIGAIYLDAGIAAAEKLVAKYIVSKLETVLAEELHIDNKSKFQEVAQATFRLTPWYKVLSEEGLDHEKLFVVGVFVGDRKLGEGEGSSKQEAQQKAAQAALTELEAKE